MPAEGTLALAAATARGIPEMIRRRSAFVGVLILSPVAALAQAVVVEPGMPMVGVPAIGPDGLTEIDAQAIAMSAGIVEVEDVDQRLDAFEVEGEDASGDDIEVTIDAQTGAILEVD